MLRDQRYNTQKARSTRIRADLLESLQLEIPKTAGYLYNRTPQRRLYQKTLFEYVTGNKSDLLYLRVHGCRAYTPKKAIIRSKKLAERAYLGHLVGYNSTNIYRIWILSQSRVILIPEMLSLIKKGFISQKILVLPSQ